MRSIQYIGTSNVRSFKAADFTTVGLTQPDTIFNKANQFTQSVPDAVAAFLLASAPQDFIDTGGAKFADLALGTGREVAYSDAPAGFTVTTTVMTDLGLSVTVTGDGIHVLWLHAGIVIQMNLGTAAAGSILNPQFHLTDEANAIQAFFAAGEAATAGQWWSDTLQVRKRLGVIPAGVQKTYRMRANVNVVGSSLTIFGAAVVGQGPFMMVEAK